MASSAREGPSIEELVRLRRAKLESLRSGNQALLSTLQQSPRKKEPPPRSDSGALGKKNSSEKEDAARSLASSLGEASLEEAVRLERRYLLALERAKRRQRPRRPERSSRGGWFLAALLMFAFAYVASGDDDFCPETLVDRNLGCGEWAEEGLCDEDTDMGAFMRNNCALSCSALIPNSRSEL